MALLTVHVECQLSVGFRKYYLLNVYGKEASAYYDLHQGLRFLKRRAQGSRLQVACPSSRRHHGEARSNSRLYTTARPG